MCSDGIKCFSLFGNEDVDLRQIPMPNQGITLADSPTFDSVPLPDEENEQSPCGSPKKDWNEVKEKMEDKKTPSKLDLVRAKLAEATKVKDGLGRPLLFCKSPSK
jgi:hypothetical protein